MRKLFEKLQKIGLNLGAKKNAVVRTTRFEKWEDAIPYLGKRVVVSLVESPDIKGYLTGISLAMDADRIVTAFLEVKGHRWEFWKCRPDNQK